MDKTRKKQAKRYIAWGCAAAVVFLLAVMPMLAAGKDTADGPEASILSANAEKRDIDTQIIGGGQLSSEAAMKLEIPEAVKLTGYLVGNGDTVSAGDAIATVDKVSVMTAITGVQETLDYLAEEIADISGEKASESVTALAGGTVKIVYAEEGENVQDVMLRDGALAVLSLDGLMAVQVERDTDLDAGDTVCVTLDNGTEVDGRVKSNLEGTLTVTLEDDGYAVGEKVTVSTEDGGRIGTGELYIFSQWNATAYSGTVSDILVEAGDTVSVGGTLMRLEDTGHTAQYQQLIDQRQEYEELMQELFRMYKTETIAAPCDGIVTGVDEDGDYLLSGAGAGNGGILMTSFSGTARGGTWVVSLSETGEMPDLGGDQAGEQPGGQDGPQDGEQNGDPIEPEDSPTYLGYVAQVVKIADGVMKVKQTPYAYPVTDLDDLPMVTVNTADMTVEATYESPLVNGETAAAGDVLLLVVDENGELRHFAKPETTPGTDAPGGGTLPGAGGMSGGSMPSGGSLSGFSGGMVQEQAFELYSLEKLTIASVTSQEHMTVEITVDELDITKLYAGQQATITVNALAGEQFAAAITEIANSGENEGGNSKFAVTLTLEKSGDMLPGMNASAFITLDTAADVLCVPVSALNEEGGQTVLYTSYDKESGTFGDPAAVTIGVADAEYVQILEGLTEGATVYYAYYDTLENENTPQRGAFSFG